MGRLFIEYIEQKDNSTNKSGKGRAADLQKPQLTASQKSAEEKKEGQLIFTCEQCGIHLADNADFLSKASEKRMQQFCGDDVSVL